MDRRFLPRPIRRWLRRRYKEAADRPLADQSSSSTGSGSSSGAVSGQGGGFSSGSARSARLTIPLPILLVLAACGVVASGALALRAYTSMQAPVQFAPAAAIGSKVTVFIIGGQFFFGTLESVDRGTVVLSDVYYFQSPANSVPTLPGAAPAIPGRSNQLIRRKDSDWHQPDRMAIPVERIMLMESIGRDSLVARWMTEGSVRQSGAN
jgi:hypothetical protein